MSGQLIDGKLVSKKVRKSLKIRIENLKANGIVPGLAAVLVGDDPASATYVRSKGKACEKLGIYSETIRKDASLTQQELIDLVHSLNNNPKIHGILVQSPVPSHIDELAVTLSIDPAKDVDGFHPYNVGMMLLGRGGLLPCTPYGIIKLMEEYEIDPTGKEVVIVGRSNIVGKPIAAMLMQKGK
ncbi:MAG: tetrahydrofolate dehydrogenase/cyclohydrolase catalytic domain-containing protein, partial [candidate division Zixibacteria bacterium]|nr:tetrahydrofolate dehydrogenase/cyclohydrolase catalytic domain-containing protein [candidate division Zixibacteria bacterium]